MALNAKQVANAKFDEDGKNKHWDERGMFLLITPKSKLWRLKYRLNGKEKLFALGKYDDVSLAVARERRDDARKLIAKGVDPVEVKRERKRQQEDAKANSFEAVARNWHKRRTSSTKNPKKWSEDHAARIIWSLEQDVFPYIGSRPIAEITAPEMLAVLERIETRGALDHMVRVKQRCSGVFRFAIATHKATQNPVAHIDPEALERREVQHRKFIARDELPELLTRLDDYEGEPLTKLALKLVVLTFVRSEELRGARWREFDLNRAEWRIPEEPTKGHKTEHIVPLSTQSLAVLVAIRKHRYDDDDLLFPAVTGGGRFMSENTLLYALYRLGYHGRATVHGFRSTASTILNELGFMPDVIERQLAHTDNNKVRAAYNHAQYLPERRKLMQAWGEYVDAAATQTSALG